MPWTPSPLTGTFVLACCAPPSGYRCVGPPSTLQSISAMPDGLPPAVAVTYCAPSVTGTSPGDCSDTDGWLLSTGIVFVYAPPVHAPAASHPSITSGIAPCP